MTDISLGECHNRRLRHIPAYPTPDVSVPLFYQNVIDTASPLFRLVHHYLTGGKETTFGTIFSYPDVF
ncbi:MAG: hypothetical protein ACOC41_02755 [Chitinivibrionales bacterium]